ncbi:hypothetical protein E6O75_ATG08211 [Venturia nashicola]|uniref:Zn(2)-C6 fungal-type domain-containing protein n=1 Tax=Venturia nashicola TaxID=86259 RepID=A0A4Z1P0E1_9PEZI|nr:hypothetical protein E6O75_ATG08211 [Venturia nashicola]
MDFPNGHWNGHFAAEQWPWPSGNNSFQSTTQHTPGTVFEISESDATMGLDQYPTGETSSCTVSPESSTPFSERESAVARVRNKPIPRKGHTKSRRGCFNCKRRKIKCQETQPACGNCEKAGIVCDYPKIVQQQQQTEVSIIRQPQATNAAFSMTDMRFFHHFLVRAYPQIPAGADAVWTLEVPAFAQEYEFLMRAMLALGASHLSITTETDLNSQALAHRVEAVNLLNKALARPAITKEEADARFAAFMILTFQSSCMADGIFDFLTMFRGCMFQGKHIRVPESAFAAFLGEHNQTSKMNERFTDAQLENLDTKTLGEAVASLAAILPLCKTDVELHYHKLLTNIVNFAYTSPKSAYKSFVELHNIVGVISHGDFQRMIDRSNGVSQLLLSHFMASHVLIHHLTIYEGLTREHESVPIYRVFKGWMRGIGEGLKPSLRKYNAWPFSFVVNFGLEKPGEADAEARMAAMDLCKAPNVRKRRERERTHLELNRI